MKLHALGIDLGKTVFHLVGLDATGRVVVRKKCSRRQLLAFTANFDAKDAQGNVVHWGGETFAPSTLTKSGWTKKTLKPGDRITIAVFPSKAGAPFGLVSSVVLADGQKFVPVSPETASQRTDGEP